MEFEHHQSAHCESGATSNLLRNAGFPISEAMAFGIGSGLFFAYLPIVRIMGLPLTTYRSFPGGIFKKACKRLGIPYQYRTFRDMLTGVRVLDQYLQNGQAVGVRGSIYWLPYMPEEFRFQFNAHSYVVIGKNDQDSYRISDPVIDKITECPSRALNKSRFAKGMLAPKGLIYFPERLDRAADGLPMPEAIRAGIREVVQRMFYAPPPFFGVSGIRFLGRQIAKWPKKLKDVETQKLYLANVVRMQEEIGTGGAGFRFLYAAFLQEAGEMLNQPTLLEASRQLTDTGNVWREFATLSAQFCKDRLPVPFEEIPKLLAQVADREEKVFRGIGRNYL